MNRNKGHNVSDSDHEMDQQSNAMRSPEDLGSVPTDPSSTSHQIPAENGESLTSTQPREAKKSEQGTSGPDTVEKSKVRGGKLLRRKSPETETPDTPGADASITSSKHYKQEEVRSELAKSTYRALWAREVKESLASGDPQRVLKALSSISPREVNNVSTQYHKLYGNSLLQHLEQQIGTSYPNEFNQALFILEGRPVYAQALAVDHALRSEHHRIKSIQLALGGKTPSDALLKAYFDLFGANLADIVKSILPDGDKQIVQAILASQPAKATALWLLKELSSTTIDTTTLEEICISGALSDPKERSEQFYLHTGMTLDSILCSMPNDLIKEEIKAILSNHFTDAHAIRVGRLLRQTNLQINPSDVHEQITQLLLIYALREKNFLFRCYRERYQTSLHDDVMRFTDELEGRKNQVPEHNHEPSASTVETIVHALLNSVDVDNALRLLQSCDKGSILQIDTRVKKQANISLRDLIKGHLQGADPSEIESALQRLPEQEQMEQTHNPSHSNMNVLSSKLMDTYSTHGSILDQSIDKTGEQFAGSSKERDQLERQDEEDFLALVDIVDADIEAYRRPKTSLTVAGAKSSSFAAAILCFIFVELLDYYIDNISPSIFVSIFVAVMMGLVAESIIQPYLQNRLVNAEKLVEKVQQKRSSSSHNHTLADNTKRSSEEFDSTSSS